jgi:hypothetical protein
MHLEAGHHSQCDDEERDAVAGGGQLAGVMFMTIAPRLVPR